MPGVEYCRSHYPWKAKRPSLVVGALIGMIALLGLQLAWDALTISRAEAEQGAVGELQADYASLTNLVYRNVSLACQGWKNAYLISRADAAGDINSYDRGAWDMLDDTPAPEFSVETWEHYRPLFDEVLDACAGQLDEIVGTQGALLSPEFKTLVVETKESFEVARRTYRFARMMSDAANRGPFFAYPFREATRAVAKLARESNRRQAEAMSKAK